MSGRSTPRFTSRARIGTPRSAELDLEGGPGLAELLESARERKGVDLFRAERETKIRARYLAALEAGDYSQLPGAVYTKGFLRNYALYLGLDPDDVLDRFHRERGDTALPAPTIAIPKPLAAPRQGLTITPGVIAAAFMTLGIVAFAVYLGLQLFRFAKPPTISVTDPSIAVVEVGETTTSYELRGSSSPGASITVVTPGRDPIRGNADADGRWLVEVELRRGRNQFQVSATDPETGKQAEAPATIFITVPFSAVQAPTLTLDQPADGAEFQNGAIPIEGLAMNATAVTITATLVEAAAPAAATPAPTATPKAKRTPEPSASPAAPAGPTTLTVAPADDGSFSAPLELTAGRWSITVTASGAAGKAASITRNVSVVYTGVAVVVTVEGGKAWIKAWVDGQVDPGLGGQGKVLGEGKSLTFNGEESVEVRTGQSAVTYFTLNGTDLGNLGGTGTPTTWLFAPPNKPVETQRR